MDFAGKHHTINNISESEMNGYFALLSRIGKTESEIIYMKLGETIVKVESNIPLLISQLEKQLAFILVDDVEKYDKAFYIWKEDIKSILSVNVQNATSFTLNPKKADGSYLSFSLENETLEAYNAETGALYLLYPNFDIETIRRMGHIAARQIYQLSKSSNQILVHSATVGVNDKGVLLSARGGGGKSTLAISTMLNGFQYVAEDYTILRKSAEGLFAYPVYSTMNLSPEMKEQMSGLKVNYMWNSW